RIGSSQRSGREPRLHTHERVSRAIETLPELPDRRTGGRMHEMGGDIRERTQHVGTLEQVGARQNEPRLLATEVAIEKNVEVHGARRPFRCIAWPAATLLDLAQAFDHARQWFGGLESHDEVDEIRALEPDRAVAIPRRALERPEHVLELGGGEREIALRFDVASGGDIDVWHEARAVPSSTGRYGRTGVCRAGGLRQFRAPALDRDANVARFADCPWLVEREPHPLHTELLENEERRSMRERLDELEIRSFDERDDALGEPLVIERVGHFVAQCRPRAIDRQLEVDD